MRSGGGDISRKLDITLNSILGHSTEDQPHAALSRASRVIRSQNYLTQMLQVGYSMIEGLGTTMGYARSTRMHRKPARPMNADDREKIRAEIGKLMAETAKINAEARWYPFVAAGGVFGAAFALAKLIGAM